MRGETTFGQVKLLCTATKLTRLKLKISARKLLGYPVGATTLNITTLSIITLSIMTLSIMEIKICTKTLNMLIGTMTFRIATLSIIKISISMMTLIIMSHSIMLPVIMTI